jgi:hypothetical protein
MKRLYRNISKPSRPIRTIEEYVKAKKRFSSANFTQTDRQQIESISEGFFVVNNCKVPVKDGALLINQWINKHERTIVPLTDAQKIANKKESQKRSREKTKTKRLNPIETVELSHDMTCINMPNLFRDYGAKRTLTVSAKRRITAIHGNNLVENPKVHYGQFRIKKTAGIPIQQLLKTAAWLIMASKDRGEKSTYESYRQYITRIHNAPKTYREIMKKVHEQRAHKI